MNRTYAIAPHAPLALGETGLVSPQGWEVGGGKRQQSTWNYSRLNRVRETHLGTKVMVQVAEELIAQGGN
jgi:hypothetical protein